MLIDQSLGVKYNKRLKIGSVLQNSEWEFEFSSTGYCEINLIMTHNHGVTSINLNRTKRYIIHWN